MVEVGAGKGGDPGSAAGGTCRELRSGAGEEARRARARLVGRELLPPTVPTTDFFFLRTTGASPVAGSRVPTGGPGCRAGPEEGPYPPGP